MSCNEKFWVEQVTLPHPPPGEGQGVGKDKGGGVVPTHPPTHTHTPSLSNTRGRAIPCVCGKTAKTPSNHRVAVQQGTAFSSCRCSGPSVPGRGGSGVPLCQAPTVPQRNLDHCLKPLVGGQHPFLSGAKVANSRPKHSEKHKSRHCSGQLLVPVWYPPLLSFPTPGKTVPHHPMGDGHQATVPPPPRTTAVHAHLQAQKLQHKTTECSIGCVPRAADVRRPTP